jgi:hypothetical protein
MASPKQLQKRCAPAECPISHARTSATASGTACSNRVPYTPQLIAGKAID